MSLESLINIKLEFGGLSEWHIGRAVSGEFGVSGFSDRVYPSCCLCFIVDIVSKNRIY